jgi:hypothetical protein
MQRVPQEVSPSLPEQIRKGNRAMPTDVRKTQIRIGEAGS